MNSVRKQETFIQICRLCEKQFLELYRDRVCEAAKRVALRFTSAHGEEIVSQVSLRKDPRSGISSIGFETKGHADLIIENWIVYCRSCGEWAGVQTLGRWKYNLNPTTFRYRGFHHIIHLELRPCYKIDYRDLGEQEEIMTMIEKNLLTVRDRLVRDRVFEALKCEPCVWLGISSMDDFYDHVIGGA